MQAGLYVALSSQQVLVRQLETVANNVANMNTTGYHAEMVSFESVLSAAEPDKIHFVNVSEVTPSMRQGTLVQSGNPMDVAISGEGWFAIQTPNGVAYTRDGRMKTDPFGELKSIAGHTVLDSGQAPILTNPNGGPIEISPDGRITQDGNRIADIGVFELPEGSLTTRFENSAFFANADGLPIAPGGDTQVVQGYTESSNVDAINEMASLMAITKNFESLNSTLRDAEQALDQAVRELGNTSG